MCGGEQVNCIVFDRSLYDNDTELWNDIFTTIRILIKNEEIITLEYEDCGIYVLQHDSGNEALLNARPYWLLGEDWETLRQVKEQLSEKEKTDYKYFGDFSKDDYDKE